MGKEVAKEVKEYFQGQRNKAKKRVTDAKAAYFERSQSQLVSDLRQVAPLIAALVNLVKKFAAAYSAAKQGKGVVDFNDLEHLCLALLRDPQSSPGKTRPSEVAGRLKAKFREIMVDEYQDTNRPRKKLSSLLPMMSGLTYLWSVMSNRVFTGSDWQNLNCLWINTSGTKVAKPLVANALT